MADTVTCTLELDMGYTNTDFTRTYRIAGLSEAIEDTAEDKIIYYNNNIPAADRNIFISDDYDAEDPNYIIGQLQGIVAARFITVTETKIT